MSANIVGRRRRSVEEWQALVAEQEQSEHTQAAFCRLKGITVAGLGYWRRRFRQKAEVDNRRAIGDWIELPRMDAGTSGGWHIELELSHGVCLRLKAI